MYPQTMFKSKNNKNIAVFHQKVVILLNTNGSYSIRYCIGLVTLLHGSIHEPCNEKTCLLHMQKPRGISGAQLHNRASDQPFVFAT